MCVKTGVPINRLISFCEMGTVRLRYMVLYHACASKIVPYNGHHLRRCKCVYEGVCVYMYVYVFVCMNRCIIVG